MIDWEAIGKNIGESLGKFVESIGLGDKIRAHYAAQFGKCRVCDAPLGGPSPERICEPCHASELLNRGFGGNNGGDA